MIYLILYFINGALTIFAEHQDSDADVCFQSADDAITGDLFFYGN
jgi:hypothetical protein